jgi:hypothetical protein
MHRRKRLGQMLQERLWVMLDTTVTWVFLVCAGDGRPREGSLTDSLLVVCISYGESIAQKPEPVLRPVFDVEVFRSDVLEHICGKRSVRSWRLYAMTGPVVTYL